MLLPVLLLRAGPDCDNLFDNGRLCFIMDHPLNTSTDPFPSGEWSLFTPVDYYAQVR